MDLISAIKSGKRFKPVNSTRWFDAYNASEPCAKKLDVPIPWLLRDSWEVEESEPEIKITRSEFLQKMRTALRDREKAEQIADYFGLG